MRVDARATFGRRSLFARCAFDATCMIVVRTLLSLTNASSLAVAILPRKDTIFKPDRQK